MYRVDLNSDLGESFGVYRLEANDEILKYVTSANIACGMHAGDPMVMAHTVALAKQYGVGVGVHPGYPDLQGFGRRKMTLSPAEVKNFVLYQIGALAGFSKAEGLKIAHISPHGTLGNLAQEDYPTARAICEATALFDPSIRVLYYGNSCLKRAADELGLPSVSMVFADRAYEEDGSLVARGKPGAMIEDEALAISRVIRMVREGTVEAITGKVISVKAESILVHGDGAKALAFVTALRRAFEREGIEVKGLAAE